MSRKDEQGRPRAVDVISSSTGVENQQILYATLFTLFLHVNFLSLIKSKAVIFKQCYLLLNACLMDEVCEGVPKPTAPKYHLYFFCTMIYVVTLKM